MITSVTTNHNNNSSNSNNNYLTAPSQKNLNAKSSISILPHEDWNELQYACSIENLDGVKAILHGGIDANWAMESNAVPQTTPLHIACRTGNIELVKLLMPHCNINRPDQLGFTPLHYATVARQKDLVLFLLDQGASAAATSKNGSTAKDLAEHMAFNDILDALQSRFNLETDPTLPMFREWLNSLGGGQYLDSFIREKYDLRFIAEKGLTKEDLDVVGIPPGGLRRKLEVLHDLNKFYTPEEEEDEEEEDDEEGDGDDEEDEDDGDEDEEDGDEDEED